MFVLPHALIGRTDNRLPLLANGTRLLRPPICHAAGSAAMRRADKPEKGSTGKGVRTHCLDCAIDYATWMARPRRADEASGLYHALNRGNARSALFHKDADYEAFERKGIVCGAPLCYSRMPVGRSGMGRVDGTATGHRVDTP